MKKKSKISFKYSMFWILWGLLCWIIGRFFNTKNIDIFLIIVMSISTLITAPLSYFIINRHLKEIELTQFCTLVVPLYIVFMALIGFVLYFFDFLS